MAAPRLSTKYPRGIRGGAATRPGDVFAHTEPREKFVHGARVVRVLGVVSFEQHDLGHGVVSRLRGEVMLQFATDVERHLLGRRHGRDHDEASHRLACASALSWLTHPGAAAAGLRRRGVASRDSPALRFTTAPIGLDT